MVLHATGTVNTHIKCSTGKESSCNEGLWHLIVFCILVLPQWTDGVVRAVATPFAGQHSTSMNTHYVTWQPAI